ncbi:DUF2254 domain-containing protein [Nocardioides gilvus]|uniref:DUF2254 domain-containing protein n=1 Tax=Nocardioides gilvus TaxID=1735589 RepID=UPI000D74508D|nr:DUF2254 domain-containing protein [Nocardioides gilvus]
MSKNWPDSPRLSRWDALWRRFWALPVTIASISLALGLLVPLIDASLEETPVWVFQGGVDGARSVLSSIAGAMISVTGLVFSITIVVLQLASSQFSPRILGSFLESRVVQLTLGFFTGSFLYALTVLRAVRGGDDGRVPQLAVTVSYVYVIVAVAMFLAFIHHITTSVQVSEVMADVRRRTLAAARRLAREESTATWSPRPGAQSVEVRNDDRCGYLTSLSRSRLLKIGEKVDGVVELDLTPGDHLVAGQVIGRVWAAEVSDAVREQVSSAVVISHERDIGADPAFGLRQLLDIAERALSTGVNDPTTAIQAVNEIHVVLRAAVQLRDPSPYLESDGEVVALYRPQRTGVLLEETVAELLHHGGDSPRVVRRLRAVFEDLVEIARPEHRSVAERALEHVQVAQAEQQEDPTG